MRGPKWRCLTVGRRLRDLRPLSAWPFSSTFVKRFPKWLKRSKYFVVAVGRQSAVTSSTVAWQFSDFFSILANRLKRPTTQQFNSQPTVAWPPTIFRLTVQRLFSKKCLIAIETSKKRCLTVGRRVAWPQPLSRDRSATFGEIFPNRLERPKNVVWQSAEVRVNSEDGCVTEISEYWTKCFLIAWNVQSKRCLTVGRRSRSLRPLSRDRSCDFRFNKFC